MGQVIISGGRAIGCEEAGSGDATPLLFLHGVGSDKSVWRRQLDFFGISRRAIAFDYPGYCDSDPAPPAATRDDYAAAMWAALDALGIDRAHISGLSLGGVIAIAMHHAAPARCASLILADSFAVHPDGAAIHDRSIVASSDMAALAKARTTVLLAANAAPDLHDEVRATMAAIDPRAFRIGAKAVWLADQRDRVAKIAVPTLVIVGAEDTVTPPRLSRDLADAIPGAKREVIANAGHLANIEQPDAFNGLVGAFIAEIGNESGTK